MAELFPLDVSNIGYYSGSFSGSFQGDGSKLTGISGGGSTRSIILTKISKNQPAAAQPIKNVASSASTSAISLKK